MKTLASEADLRKDERNSCSRRLGEDRMIRADADERIVRFGSRIGGRSRQTNDLGC